MHEQDDDVGPNRGKLDLESKPGETTFRIRLRRRRERVTVTAAVPAEHPAS